MAIRCSAGYVCKTDPCGCTGACVAQPDEPPGDDKPPAADEPPADGGDAPAGAAGGPEEPPEACPPGVPVAMCFADPCKVSNNCTAGEVCIPSYCGGCFAKCARKVPMKSPKQPAQAPKQPAQGPKQPAQAPTAANKTTAATAPKPKVVLSVLPGNWKKLANATASAPIPADVAARAVKSCEKDGINPCSLVRCGFGAACVLEPGCKPVCKAPTGSGEDAGAGSDGGAGDAVDAGDASDAPASELKLEPICPPGSVYSLRAKSCAPCKAGAFADDKAGECKACATGHYSSDKGATACKACEPGTFAASEGSAKCEKCTAGTNSGKAAAKCG